MIRQSQTKVISFVAYSGTGKTTLIEKLIKELKNRKLKLAVIKHDAHDFEMDIEGKDTYRYKHAGADIVNIFSKMHCGMSADNEVLFGKVSDKYAPSLDTVLKSIPDTVDIVIVEGCRQSDIPKIGMTRKAAKKGLSMNPKELVALVTDENTEKYLKDNPELRIFGLEDIKDIADYIVSGEFELAGFKPDKPGRRSKPTYKFGANINEVLEIIDSFTKRTKKEYIPLAEANGRVVARDYVAESNFPPFKRSPLDGYAFRAADSKGASKESPVEFKITEEIPAGKTPEFTVRKGYAAKILTGAPIPEGANVVERFEATEFTEETVKIFREYDADTNIVPAGEDFKKGYKAIKAGTEITCFNMAVMGILGIANVQVYKKPKVAFISTGSELVDVDVKLPDSKIRNSSVYSLGAMAEDAGAESIYCGIVRDDVELIADKIKRASKFADVICTTGGASVGDYDLIMSALDRIGAKILVWKVKMKPGMAFILAKYNGCIFMGFSGNPGAATISFTMFGRTLIKRLAGQEMAKPEIIQLALAEEITKKSPGGRYIIGTLKADKGKALFVPNEIKGNGALSSLQGGTVVGILPPNTEPLKAGTMIDAYIL